jgi:hypothetical protein
MPCLSQTSRIDCRYPGGGTSTPFVPVTVSIITAATFCGPSYMRISSRWGAPVQTGQGSGWPAGQRYV